MTKHDAPESERSDQRRARPDRVVEWALIGLIGGILLHAELVA